MNHPLSNTGPQASLLPGADSLHPLRTVPEDRTSLVPEKEAVRFRAALCMLLYVCHCDGGANLHGVTQAAYRSAFRRLPPEGKGG
ncbi:hypothetical protein NSQ90_06980 [Paenibacillus sp. FSL H7-0737]|uniref:hypothetical protein n=1 Tax=unclassified Paenibacillus TaxID=185978 RepID=UPI0012E091E8|nr:hypothetical protein [Paenibacillus sp. FSL H7-0737]